MKLLNMGKGGNTSICFYMWDKYINSTVRCILLAVFGFLMFSRLLRLRFFPSTTGGYEGMGEVGCFERIALQSVGVLTCCY